MIEQSHPPALLDRAYSPDTPRIAELLREDPAPHPAPRRQVWARRRRGVIALSSLAVLLLLLLLTGAAVWFIGDQTPIEQRIEELEVALEDSRWEDAVRAATVLIELEPEDSDILAQAAPRRSISISQSQANDFGQHTK